MASASTPAKQPAQTPPSSGKRSVDNLKVVLPPATGNKTVDAEEEARHTLMVDMFKEVMADRSLVLPLYNKMLECIKVRDSEAIAGDAETFNKISTVGKTSPEYLVYHLTQVSALGVEQLLEIKRKDEDAIMKLVQYDTGLHPNLKLSNECRVKDFWGDFLQERSKLCGSRLKTLTGLVKPGNLLDWSAGVYDLKFCGKTNLLVRVTHRPSGLSVNIGEGYHITTSWTLLSNWSDFEACLQMKPMPAVKLCALFSSKEAGPHKIKNYGCKVNEFGKDMKVRFEQWELARSGQSAGKQVCNQAKASLDAMSKTKKTEALKRARTEANKIASEKKAKSAVSFTRG